MRRLRAGQPVGQLCRATLQVLERRPALLVLALQIRSETQGITLQRQSHVVSRVHFGGLRHLLRQVFQHRGMQILALVGGPFQASHNIQDLPSQVGTSVQPGTRSFRIFGQLHFQHLPALCKRFRRGLEPQPARQPGQSIAINEPGARADCTHRPGHSQYYAQIAGKRHFLTIADVSRTGRFGKHHLFIVNIPPGQRSTQTLDRPNLTEISSIGRWER